MKNKILVVASGGGHWIQMLRLRPAFEGLDVAFVSVELSVCRRGSAAPLLRGA